MRGLIVAAIVTSLSGCMAVKPEDHVQLGMSLTDVEASVGPPRWSVWRYQLVGEIVEVSFEGNRAWASTTIRQGADTKTYQSWYRNDLPTGARYKLDAIGRNILASREEIIPSAPAVKNGDTRAQVMKLYGTPREMRVEFVAWPLSGEFKDGRLIKWNTTPPPPRA